METERPSRKAIELIAALHRAVATGGLAIVQAAWHSPGKHSIGTQPRQLGDTDPRDVVAEIADYIKGQEREIEQLHREAKDWSDAHAALEELATSRARRLAAYERFAGRSQDSLLALSSGLDKIAAERTPLQLEAAKLPDPAPPAPVGADLPRIVIVPELDPK